MECVLLPFDTYMEKLESFTKKNANLRNSSKREAILRVIYDSKKHLTPDEIYREVKERYDGSIGIATVYRTLSFFEEAGLVHQISIDDDVKRYEIDSGGHHDHLICTECGKIIEFFDETLENLQGEIAGKRGFTLKDHEMKLYGICADCK